MNKEEKITISVNEEDVQNIINAYEKDIEYINQLEKEKIAEKTAIFLLFLFFYDFNIKYSHTVCKILQI